MRCNMKTTQIICFWLLTIQQPFIWRGYLAFAQFFVPSTLSYIQKQKLKKQKKRSETCRIFLERRRSHPIQCSARNLENQLKESTPLGKVKS